MDAIKLPMLYCEMKFPTEKVNLEKYIRRVLQVCYGEHGEMYVKEIRELDTLRNNAIRATHDNVGCVILKRYYAQLSSLKGRFWDVPDVGVAAGFNWVDVYTDSVIQGGIDLELAAVLYNVGALHTELGAMDSRATAMGMKSACTHFQCASWAFEVLREGKRHPQVPVKAYDLGRDVMSFMHCMMLAQAQECIFEKSIADGRKHGIIAKVVAQITDYLNSALAILIQANTDADGDRDAPPPLSDAVGSKVYREWKRFVEFKICFFTAVTQLYMGHAALEASKWGEQVAWYQWAESKAAEAMKLAKSLDRSEITDAIKALEELIKSKREAAVKDNDFIYHDSVPSADKLTNVKGASLVKPISFSVTDKDIWPVDIFARLVPMEAHELASIYSENKDRIMREIKNLIDQKNSELDSFMDSLQLDRERLRPNEFDLPEELIEICAALSARGEGTLSALDDKITKLNMEISRTGENISQVRNLIEEQVRRHEEHQKAMSKSSGTRREEPLPMTLIEFKGELEKYQKTHADAQKSAAEFIETFGKHKSDLVAMMECSAAGIASLLPAVPQLTPGTDQREQCSRVEKLLDKVDEMRLQRSQLETELREAIHRDDVIKQVLSYKREEIKSIFDAELKKFDKQRDLIQQNLNAQENILKALVEANAIYADTRKEILENSRQRSERVASLMFAYEVFSETETNVARISEFYEKFSSQINRLLTRVSSLGKVQDEERSTELEALKKTQQKNKISPTVTLGASQSTVDGLATSLTTGLTLRDVMAARKNSSGVPSLNSSIAPAANPYPVSTASPFAPVMPRPSNPTVPYSSPYQIPVSTVSMPSPYPPNTYRPTTSVQYPPATSAPVQPYPQYHNGNGTAPAAPPQPVSSQVPPVSNVAYNQHPPYPQSYQQYPQPAQPPYCSAPVPVTGPYQTAANASPSASQQAHTNGNSQYPVFTQGGFQSSAGSYPPQSQQPFNSAHARSYGTPTTTAQQYYQHQYPSNTPPGGPPSTSIPFSAQAYQQPQQYPPAGQTPSYSSYGPPPQQQQSYSVPGGQYSTGANQFPPQPHPPADGYPQTNPHYSPYPNSGVVTSYPVPASAVPAAVRPSNAPKVDLLSDDSASPVSTVSSALPPPLAPSKVEQTSLLDT